MGYNRFFALCSNMVSTGRIIDRPVKHAPKSLLPAWMLEERTKCLNNVDINNKSGTTKTGGSIVYWMQRDVRTEDNWALLWASSIAAEQKMPIYVVYILPPPPQAIESKTNTENTGHQLPPSLKDMPMTRRHGDFLLGGLECVHKELQNRGIPFHVLMPPSHEEVGETMCNFVLNDNEKRRANLVVADFSPLKHARQWIELQAAPLLDKANVPFYQVDAHNIVPVWVAGEGKRQIGARTLRPRIHKVVNKYLQEYPELCKVYQRQTTVSDRNELPRFDRDQYEEYLKMDESVPAVTWATPGTEAGMKQFASFVENGLKHYEDKRNDPTRTRICSNLSPWTNHGHVSFQRITMEVKKLNKYAAGAACFIEEGVIRRELSDNFCYYTPNEYDSLGAALGWAQETLRVHSSDPRKYLYTLQELEESRTYDDLWNAAQFQVVREGRMHGFLRMYWAKKILEWTISPEFALRAAQYFNDKYALDGKDPNGFVGVGWSIMGIHDQGWKEREIFGKIRYMNYEGCKRKFSVPDFVAKYRGAAENAAAATITGGHDINNNKTARKQKSSTSSSSKSRLAKKLKT